MRLSDPALAPAEEEAGVDGAGPEDGTGGAEGGELEAAASEEWKRGALPDGDAFWWRENADESDGVEISLVSPGEMAGEVGAVHSPRRPRSPGRVSMRGVHPCHPRGFHRR